MANNKEMKELTAYVVCENNSYDKFFCRVDTYEKTVLHLYGVVVKTPFGASTHYVLAPNKEEAISQATCKNTTRPISNNPDISCTAYQLPMLIRGWSTIEF